MQSCTILYVYLQNNVLSRRVIMTALLVVPSMPVPGERLIERLHSPKRKIHLMAVVPNHLREIVHECIVVLRCQVVLVAICIPTAQDPHRFYETWDQGIQAVADLIVRWVEELLNSRWVDELLDSHDGVNFWSDSILCWQCHEPKTTSSHE